MEGGGDSLLVFSGIIPLGCEWTACLAYSGMHFEPDNICKRMEQAVPQIQCHGIQGPFEAGFVDNILSRTA